MSKKVKLYGVNEAPGDLTDHEALKKLHLVSGGFYCLLPEVDLLAIRDLRSKAIDYAESCEGNVAVIGDITMGDSAINRRASAEVTIYNL